MARISKNMILGTLKDVIIYEVDGKIVVARKGGYNKKKYHQLENLEGHRKRGVEFKYSTHLGKMIRLSLNDFKHLFKMRLCGFLTKEILLVCKNDALGKMGERSVDLRANGESLEGFNLSKIPFNSFSQIPYNIEVNTDRNLIRLEIPEFYPLIKCVVPSGTNCFQLIMTATIVNAFKYSQEKKDYLPEFGKGYAFTKSIISGTYNNSQLTNIPTMEIALDFIPDPEHALIICLGIEFFDSFTDRVNSKKEWRAMKIVKIN